MQWISSFFYELRGVWLLGGRSGLAFCPPFFFVMRIQLAANATYWATWMYYVGFEVRADAQQLMLSYATFKRRV